MFVGSIGAPANTTDVRELDQSPVYTNSALVPDPRITLTLATFAVAQTPRSAEKPFITISADGRYQLQVPKLKLDHAGADLTGELLTSYDFESVFVATPADSSSRIQAKLSGQFTIEHQQAGLGNLFSFPRQVAAFKFASKAIVKLEVCFRALAGLEIFSL